MHLVVLGAFGRASGVIPKEGQDGVLMHLVVLGAFGQSEDVQEALKRDAS